MSPVRTRFWLAGHIGFEPVLPYMGGCLSLGMIPIARQVFWGPMAFAMIGGIIAGTVLTLIFLPALYVAAYRISPVGPHDAARVPDDRDGGLQIDRRRQDLEPAEVHS